MAHLDMKSCCGGIEVIFVRRTHRHPVSVIKEDALDTAVDLGEMQKVARGFRDRCTQSDEQERLRMDLPDHFVLVARKECPMKKLDM
jgi:hypothetical protein